MEVRDAMTTPVITAEPHTSVAALAQLLLDRRIGGVPVVDAGGHVIGVVSESDLMLRAKSPRSPSPSWDLIVGPGSQAETYLKEHSETVAGLMTKPPVCVSETMPLGEAVALMCDLAINRLPVVRDGKLAGILTRADVLRVLVAGRGRSTMGANRPLTDAEIVVAVREALAVQPWAQVDLLGVEVSHGIVRLSGVVMAEPVVRGIEQLVRDVAGVRAVECRLEVLPPLSLIVSPALD